MTEDEIKLLGRWKSDAYRLYYTTPPQQLLALNARFQSGRTSPITTFFTNNGS